MANLCAVTADTVNGVAQLHSDILKAEFLADYVSIWPTKFQNKTNGVTPRRWLSFCNPELCSIITKWLKTDGWLTNLDLLTNLRQFADNEELQAEWATAKRANTKRLAQYELQVTGLSIDPKSLFDIQVKRIHEYKRQLLNILGAIYRYKTLKLSLGDARAYYLSTAKNELGVVSAESIGGATMVPISWTEMQCSLTGQIEQRKVAKGGV